MFNIRVYGILINEYNQVLVSDEWIRGQYITKFCGGGLEQGEGSIECLKREFMEEMQLPVEVTGHFYTTDFFQQSAFDVSQQIISIYYLVKALAPISVPLRNQPFDFDEQQKRFYELHGETETFRLVHIDDFSADTLTLPIDKLVAGMILERHTPSTFFEEQLVLENERVRLEPLQPQHINPLWEVASQKELWLYTSSKVSSRADFERYCQQAFNERKLHQSYPFAVYDKLEKRYGGSTRYGNVSFTHKRAEIGWTWYHPDLQRTGLNRACKFLLLRHAFENLDLNRIEFKTSLTNKRSQQAIDKIGASKEGILRKHIINDDGTARDTVYYSILKQEWPATRLSVFSNF